MKKKKILFTALASLLFATVATAQVPFCTEDTFVSLTPSVGVSNDVVLLNDKIYSINPWGTNKSLNEYNTTTGTTTSINQPDFTLGETSLTEHNGSLYVFGGYTGSRASGMSKVYSLSTKTWQSLPDLPIALIQTSAVTLNNNIYITGGSFGFTKQYFYKFDPVTKTYTTLTPPTLNRNNSKLIVFNNKIYCLGGHYYDGSSKGTSDFSIYDAGTNSWKTLPNMPFLLTKVSATVWGNYLYVFGGATVSGDAFAVLTASYKYFVYDFINNQWIVSEKTMPKSLYKGGAVTLNDAIYIMDSENNMKYYCAFDCDKLITQQPVNNTLNADTNAQFSVSTNYPQATYQWQTNPDNFGWMNIPENSSYSGTKTNTVKNVQLSTHLQQFRAIAKIDAYACEKTSEVATLSISNTCTNYITVTDALLINVPLLGISTPDYVNTIKVYPNPAKDHITIDNGNYNAMNGYSIKIQNSLGQTLFNQQVNQAQFYIDLSTWSGNGLYFIQIIDPSNNTVDTRKIIIE
jgi:N-acetylneuraminic acid mutarotase